MRRVSPETWQSLRDGQPLLPTATVASGPWRGNDPGWLRATRVCGEGPTSGRTTRLPALPRAAGQARTCIRNLSSTERSSPVSHGRCRVALGFAVQWQRRRQQGYKEKNTPLASPDIHTGVCDVTAHLHGTTDPWKERVLVCSESGDAIFSLQFVSGPLPPPRLSSRATASVAFPLDHLVFR